MTNARNVIIEKVGEFIRLDVHQETITTGFFSPPQQVIDIAPNRAHLTEPFHRVEGNT